MTDRGFAYGEFGERIHGDLRGDVDLPAFVGRVKPEHARLLAHLQVAGDDYDLGSETRERVAESVALAVPGLATRAVHEGHDSLMAFLSGVTQRDLDTSPVAALTRLLKLLRPQGRVMVLTGATNSGKTNVGFLCIDVADKLFPGLQIIGNIPRDAFTAEWIDRYSAVRDFEELVGLVEDEPKREKIILVDDASLDHAEGQSNSHVVREKMGELVRLAAKRHARIAYLAHRDDGKGVAKHIRTMPDTQQLACSSVPAEDGTIEEYRVILRDGVGVDGTDGAILGKMPEASAKYDPDAVAYKLFNG
ncbi:hypothetical protein [Haladaptatus sp. CMAA 1911]|uniref:hypothetical protein n=1 Tax=unclassified Haladaptatus TaxID=2622732 RepID=UPI003753F27F